MLTRKIIYSLQSLTLMLFGKRLNGPWSGWTRKKVFMKEWLPLRLWRESSSADHFAPFFGLKNAPLCLDWLSAMSLFHVTRAFILTLPATSTLFSETNCALKLFKASSRRQLPLRRSLSLRVCLVIWSASTASWWHSI